MPRKKRAPEAQPTDAAHPADATAAHAQQLAEAPVEHPLPDQPGTDPFDAAIAARQAGEFEAPASPPAEPTADTHTRREEAVATHQEVQHALKHQATHTQREQSRRADPYPFHAVHFEDGFRIRLQESDSRRTVEIQFGDGSRAAQPKNFAAVKDVLRAAGMHWNGECAWVADLVPERGSLAQREDARRHNAALRAEIEEKVFPAVIALEEAVRGPVALSDDFRGRIQKAVAGNGRA